MKYLKNGVGQGFIFHAITLFLYKKTFYKNTEAQITQKLRTN